MNGIKWQKTAEGGCSAGSLVGSFDAFAAWFALKWVIFLKVLRDDAARYEHAVFLYALGQLLR